MVKNRKFEKGCLMTEEFVVKKALSEMGLCVRSQATMTTISVDVLSVSPGLQS